MENRWKFVILTNSYRIITEVLRLMAFGAVNRKAESQFPALYSSDPLSHVARNLLPAAKYSHKVNLPRMALIDAKRRSETTEQNGTLSKTTAG